MRIETFTLGELQENAYLLIDAEGGGAVVIDPGDYPTRLIERVNELGAEPLAVLLTHGHWDHVNGVREIKHAFDVPVYLHEADAAIYKHVAEQAELFGFHADPQPPPDHLLTGGETLELGPFRIDVIHTPGHTQGGVCYKIDDAVFVGDTIFVGGIGRYDLPGGSFEQLVKGIRQKLLTLDDNVTLYPGHGPPTTVGTERRSNPFSE